MRTHWFWRKLGWLMVVWTIPILINIMVPPELVLWAIALVLFATILALVERAITR